MRAWIRLTPEQANLKYLIPLQVANNQRNLFWGIPPLPGTDPGFDMDGSWPFVGFLFDDDKPNIVTMHVFTLDEVAFEVEDFDPLTSPISGLYLKKEAFVGLSNIMLDAAQHIAQVQTGQQSAFERISPDQLDDFHLNIYGFSPNAFYRQIRYPGSVSGTDGGMTIYYIDFDIDTASFEIMWFDRTKLDDPSFRPLDDAQRVYFSLLRA